MATAVLINAPPSTPRVTDTDRKVRGSEGRYPTMTSLDNEADTLEVVDPDIHAPSPQSLQEIPVKACFHSDSQPANGDSSSSSDLQVASNTLLQVTSLQAARGTPIVAASSSVQIDGFVSAIDPSLPDIPDTLRQADLHQSSERASPDAKSPPASPLKLKTPSTAVFADEIDATVGYMEDENEAMMVEGINGQKHALLGSNPTSEESTLAQTVQNHTESKAPDETPPGIIGAQVCDDVHNIRALPVKTKTAFGDEVEVVNTTTITFTDGDSVNELSSWFYPPSSSFQPQLLAPSDNAQLSIPPYPQPPPAPRPGPIIESPLAHRGPQNEEEGRPIDSRHRPLHPRARSFNPNSYSYNNNNSLHNTFRQYPNCNNSNPNGSADRIRRLESDLSTSRYETRRLAEQADRDKETATAAATSLLHGVFQSQVEVLSKQAALDRKEQELSHQAALSKSIQELLVIGQKVLHSKLGELEVEVEGVCGPRNATVAQGVRSEADIAELELLRQHETYVAVEAAKMGMRRELRELETEIGVEREMVRLREEAVDLREVYYKDQARVELEEELTKVLTAEIEARVEKAAFERGVAEGRKLGIEEGGRIAFVKGYEVARREIDVLRRFQEGEIVGEEFEKELVRNLGLGTSLSSTDITENSGISEENVAVEQPKKSIEEHEHNTVTPTFSSLPPNNIPTIITPTAVNLKGRGMKLKNNKNQLPRPQTPEPIDLLNNTVLIPSPPRYFTPHKQRTLYQELHNLPSDADRERQLQEQRESGNSRAFAGNGALVFTYGECGEGNGEGHGKDGKNQVADLIDL